MDSDKIYVFLFAIVVVFAYFTDVNRNLKQQIHALQDEIEKIKQRLSQR